MKEYHTRTCIRLGSMGIHKPRGGPHPILGSRCEKVSEKSRLLGEKKSKNSENFPSQKKKKRKKESQIKKKKKTRATCCYSIRHGFFRKAGGGGCGGGGFPPRPPGRAGAGRGGGGGGGAGPTVGHRSLLGTPPLGYG